MNLAGDPAHKEDLSRCIKFWEDYRLTAVEDLSVGKADDPAADREYTSNPVACGLQVLSE